MRGRQQARKRQGAWPAALRLLAALLGVTVSSTTLSGCVGEQPANAVKAMQKQLRAGDFRGFVDRVTPERQLEAVLFVARRSREKWNSLHLAPESAVERVLRLITTIERHGWITPARPFVAERPPEGAGTWSYLEGDVMAEVLAMIRRDIRNVSACYLDLCQQAGPDPLAPTEVFPLSEVIVLRDGVVDRVDVQGDQATVNVKGPSGFGNEFKLRKIKQRWHLDCHFNPNTLRLVPAPPRDTARMVPFSEHVKKMQSMPSIRPVELPPPIVPPIVPTSVGQPFPPFRGAPSAPGAQPQRPPQPNIPAQPGVSF